ncbi:MAG: hypothetical protein EAZ78_27530 [Oscillatoriales cyanobacterium]|nr:MAG: hypothetical protein EAZ94_07965 [Oscillatoriales cyanobacterium]TAE25617.1 MAG: hypothetical protein EAZ93_09715 [Oscillatoriales cyanobacterium]TAE44232.1 MAG: hypothetical protein EAZ90_07515 [Oscillatoriales cyanobacterium]TAE55133.1 MAG: hypothetical protein EAZ88_07195 [Oscillatoriales cyanobacterium]TAE67115.1 MAG: hypothetical protein EAZ86_18120 [Oscillatoriales cyanobacterium]
MGAALCQLFDRQFRPQSLISVDALDAFKLQRASIITVKSTIISNRSSENNRYNNNLTNYFA